MSEDDRDRLVAWHIMGDDRSVPPLPYSEDMCAAWRLHCHMCERVFSVRQSYLDSLTRHIHQSVGLKVAWPHALIMLEPQHIVGAALETFNITTGAREEA